MTTQRAARRWIPLLVLAVGALVAPATAGADPSPVFQISPVQEISPFDPAVTGNESGDAVISWTDNDEAVKRIRRTDGGPWSPIETVVSKDLGGPSSVDINARGDVVTAIRNLFVVRIVMEPASGPRRTYEIKTDWWANNVIAGIADNGNATVLWVDAGTQHYVDLPAAGGISADRTLPRAAPSHPSWPLHSHRESAVFNAAGAVAVTYYDYTQATVAVRQPGGEFVTTRLHDEDGTTGALITDDGYSDSAILTINERGDVASMMIGEPGETIGHGSHVAYQPAGEAMRLLPEIPTFLLSGVPAHNIAFAPDGAITVVANAYAKGERSDAVWSATTSDLRRWDLQRVLTDPSCFSDVVSRPSELVYLPRMDQTCLDGYDLYGARIGPGSHTFGPAEQLTAPGEDSSFNADEALSGTDILLAWDVYTGAYGTPRNMMWLNGFHTPVAKLTAIPPSPPAPTTSDTPTSAAMDVPPAPDPGNPAGSTEPPNPSTSDAQNNGTAGTTASGQAAPTPLRILTPRSRVTPRALRRGLTITVATPQAGTVHVAAQARLGRRWITIAKRSRQAQPHTSRLRLRSTRRALPQRLRLRATLSP